MRLVCEIDCLDVADSSAPGGLKATEGEEHIRGLTWLLTASSSLGEWEGVEKRIS